MRVNIFVTLDSPVMTEVLSSLYKQRYDYFYTLCVQRIGKHNTVSQALCAFLKLLCEFSVPHCNA